MIRFDGSEAHRRLETFPGKLFAAHIFFLLLPSSSSLALSFIRHPPFSTFIHITLSSLYFSFHFSFLFPYRHSTRRHSCLHFHFNSLAPNFVQEKFSLRFNPSPSFSPILFLHPQPFPSTFPQPFNFSFASI